SPPEVEKACPVLVKIERRCTRSLQSHELNRRLNMDLDTFLTTLYVLVDDWYKARIEPLMPRRKGGQQQMSDSEGMTVALAGQWRVGVPWQSERGVVRYMHPYGRGWFPTMLERSAFNERVR